MDLSASTRHSLGQFAPTEPNIETILERPRETTRRSLGRDGTSGRANFAPRGLLFAVAADLYFRSAGDLRDSGVTPSVCVTSVTVRATR